jgi:catechol 2,3-dioxygenase-like lactoylglutathione lyase family enzyme
MISNIFLTAVWVKDIEASKAFYIDKLGFEARDDVTLGDDFRWCTIGHPAQPELEVHLTTPGPPLSPEHCASINRALDEGGTFALGLSVDDCTATVRDLAAKGVEILNGPDERPYGVEALIRDNTGNWIVLVEHHTWTPDSIADFVDGDPSRLNPQVGSRGA